MLNYPIDRGGLYRIDADSIQYIVADPDFILYTTGYPHREIAISQLEGSHRDYISVNLKRGDYLT